MGGGSVEGAIHNKVKPDLETVHFSKGSSR